MERVRCPYCGRQVYKRHLPTHQRKSRECVRRQKSEWLKARGWMLSAELWMRTRRSLNYRQTFAADRLLEPYGREYDTGYERAGWGRPARVYKELWYPREVAAVLVWLVREAREAGDAPAAELRAAVERRAARYIDQRTKRLTPEGEAFYALLALEGR